MPNHSKHCEVALRIYGKDFSQLHRWMDFPSITYGIDHRRFRHDPDKTPSEALQLFGFLADQACLDHIILDELTSNGKNNFTPVPSSIKVQVARITRFFCRRKPKNQELTDAINLCIGSGYTVKQTSESLGISESTVYKYMDEYFKRNATPSDSALEENTLE